MEQIEAGKRKTSKDRQKRESRKEENDSNQGCSENLVSKYKETVKGTQRKVQKSKVKLHSSPFKLDTSVKDKNSYLTSNDSATTSEMTSPILDNPLASPSDIPTTKVIVESEYQTNSNPIDDKSIRLSSPSACRQSNANMHDEWDHNDRFEQTIGYHKNQGTQNKMNDSGNDQINVEHFPDADLHINRNDVQYDEFAQYQLENDHSGKSIL
jgi:hypothetical protein